MVHYTANPGATAENHYHYFNNGAGGRYASAHYFIDKQDTILIVPEDEVVFAANETGYSNVAQLRSSLPHYRGNANVCAVHIELCIEKDGSYHPNTINQTKQLISELQNKYGLSNKDVFFHRDITNKNCPANLSKATILPGKSSSYPKVARVNPGYTMMLRDKPSVKEGKILKHLPSGSAWKCYEELPNGWLNLGGGYASNVGGKFFTVN